MVRALRQRRIRTLVRQRGRRYLYPAKSGLRIGEMLIHTPNGQIANHGTVVTRSYRREAWRIYENQAP